MPSTAPVDRPAPGPGRGAPDRVVRDLLDLLAAAPGAGSADAAPVVVDVGGGSGTRSVPLALAGCRVTVIDPSIDALAILRRRAAEAGVADRVSGVQGDLEALPSVVPDGSADLVLCHRVIEAADDDVTAIAAMAAALRPGGALSLLVAGRHAAVLALAAAGRTTQALQLHRSATGSHGPSDPVQRRYDVAGATALLATAGLQVEAVRGLGVVSRWAPGVEGEAAPDGSAATLEDELGRDRALQELASELHLVGRAPGGAGAATDAGS